MNSKIHFILQGKGGIGKSMISATLAQYIQSKGGKAKCYDLDQENPTFSQYKALNVTHINVMDADRLVDPKKFDGLMGELLELENEEVVIDTGANTFSNLLAYLLENEVFQMLEDAGQKVFVHSIVGGGDNLRDTTIGFDSVAKGMQSENVVLWLNEHFGPVTSDGTPSGAPFVETKVFKAHADKIRGGIYLRKKNDKTFGDDVRRMNVKRLTIDEIESSPDFAVMERSRLKRLFSETFAQLNQVSW